MRVVWISMTIAFAAAATARADVSYQEEVVNSGMGPKKIGARKTTNRIYIKGDRQRIHSEIETTAKSVKKSTRGGPADASTILQLDRSTVLEINHEQLIYSRRSLPRLDRGGMPGPMGAATTRAAAKRRAADKRTAAAVNAREREISFRTRALPDTATINGISCKRIAAELVARHYIPGTQKVRRENRYLYQAWIATEFPGYEEIRRFNQHQSEKTSYPLLASGGLDQLANSVDDYDDLQEKLAEIEGFPIQSELKVFTKAAGQKERQLLRLQRKVASLTHTPLPDSLFEPSKDLRLVAP